MRKRIVIIGGSGGGGTPTVTINSNGTLQNYTGIVNLGTNLQLGIAGFAQLANASSVTGTLASLNSSNGTVGGYTLDATALSFADLSNNVAVYGDAGGANDNTQLNEGPNVEAALVQAGSDNSSLPGGNATLILNPNKTSWNNITLDGNATTTNNANGTVALYLTSNEISATFNVSLLNAGNIDGNQMMQIYGSTLATIALTLTSDGSTNANFISTVLIDFSNTIANDASLQNICNACIASGVGIGGNTTAALNIAGSCAPASPTTLGLITTLTGLGWTVSNN